MNFFLNRDPESRIPNPDPESLISGIQDRNFLFWARSKNFENPEIPGIGIFKPPKNPEEICSVKSQKSRGSRSEFENPDQILSRKSRNFIPWIFAESPGYMLNPRDSGFFNFGIPKGFFISGIGIFSWDGISRQKATSVSYYD